MRNPTQGPALANVNGWLDGRIFRRAHTAGFDAQRAPCATLTVTGTELGQRSWPLRRVHTAGLLVQRWPGARDAMRSPWRVTDWYVNGCAGAAARARSAVFRRAHTAGLLVQRSRARLSPALANKNVAAKAANPEGRKRRKVLCGMTFFSMDVASSGCGRTEPRPPSSLHPERPPHHEHIYSGWPAMIAHGSRRWRSP
jgi:hypothetical protein